jgi:hypothetical protein
MKTRLTTLLSVLLVSAGVYALEPFTLGNVYKLGTSTTANLPASSATILGGLIYVSDDAGVLVNSGTAWQTLAGEWGLDAYAPNTTPIASRTLVSTTTNQLSTLTNLAVVIIGANTSVTGNITFTVFDVTAAGGLCTLTKACNVGSGVTACNAIVPAAHVVELRQDSSGCGAGTVGDFNVSAHLRNN